jgi:thiamine monophosphate kinase
MSSIFHPMLSGGGLSSTGGEWAFVGQFRNALPAAPAGKHWIGDDGAVPDDGLLLKTDILVEGIHFDPENRGFEHTIAVPAASRAEMH